MALWLSDFSNRFKLTIPADSTDSSLTNFPVMINLSSSSGKTGFDASSVFDDLGDDHQKRMAVTKNDGTTQCPVEIEYWDSTEEKAVLWTKVPTVYSSVDTDLYFYWDATTSGNAVYVGDVGDAPAQSVWDNNFKLVMHMAQDPDGDPVDAIKDSTYNANHGTPDGGMTTADLVDGKIGKAIDFDGGDDCINIGDSVSLDSDYITIEAVVKNIGSGSIEAICSRDDTSNRCWQFRKTAADQIEFIVFNASSHSIITGSTDIADNTFRYVSGVWDGINISMFVDGSSDATPVAFSGLLRKVTEVVTIGTDNTQQPNWSTSVVCELRYSGVARSPDWIKVTYDSNWDDLIVFQQEDTTTSWLSDWSKRIKLTVDNTNIDSTLLDFPVLVKLSNSSGITSADVTSVFTELESDTNRKKIAVTTSDGTTQCYVEIERFDYSNNEAWLWIKVPFVDAGVTTDLYLYYSLVKFDNTAYVGDTGDAPARNVWDSNFKLVMHMAQDPNGDVAAAIKDSTSNTNHGTPGGSMTTADLVDGKIGKAIEFDGVDDRIIISDSAELRSMAAITVEFFLNVITKNNWEKILDYSGSATQNADRKYRFQFDNVADRGLTFTLWDSANVSIGDVTTLAFPTSSFCYIAGVYTGENIGDSVKIYKNGSSDVTGAGTGNDISNVNAGDFWLAGEQWAPPRNSYDGVQDEVRISNIARSAAWIKATYHSNWDGLVTFGTEQSATSWITPLAKRIKLTIPADSTDSSLTNFPVMISLSSSSGKTDFDASSIFDDLGNDHQKRMAVTKNDGTTQCPIEIEYWDATEEKAILWTKVPTVYSSVDTDIYFYWDATTSGNTAYVGTVGDAPAQAVWDDNFKLVMHMDQNPNGDPAGAIKDSTYNANHGTPDGGMTTADLVDGKIGKAIDFDGVDDHFDISTITIGTNTTFSWIMKSDITTPNEQIISGVSYTDRLAVGGSALQMQVGADGGTHMFTITHGTTITTLHEYTVIRGGDITILELYVDGVFVGSDTNVNGDSIDVYNIAGKDFSTSWVYYNGIIDEIRFSTEARSSDWIKATYHSNWDDLIVFQQEDTTTAWLSDWAKRIKLTIDKDKIDSTLVDFPIGITLVSGTHSCVFDELDYVWDGNDDFTGNNGDAPNDDLWSGGAKILNNRLYLDTSGTYGGVTSKYKFSGNLDIQVDFNEIAFPATNSWGFNFYTLGEDGTRYNIRIEYSSSVQKYHSYRDGTQGYLIDQIYNSSDSSGKFRITREGDVFKSYRWSVGSWVQNGTGLTISFMERVVLGFSIGTWDTTPFVSGDFDNFKINSGTIIWPEGSHPNHKKIAITTLDGTTQCPVEIEQWDSYNEQANLWTKVPAVDSNEDTILYLYYDKTKDDNTTYVGDTGDAPAQSVWDSDFKLVMHMAQDPNGDVVDAIKDSTSNNNHGSPSGSMTSADLVDGKIGKAIDFDGGDFIKTGGWFDLSNSNFHLSAIITLDSLAANSDTIIGFGQDDTTLPYWIFMYRNDKGGLTWQTDEGAAVGATWPVGAGTVTLDTCAVDLVRNRSTGNFKIAVDGTVVVDETYNPTFQNEHSDGLLQIASWSASGGNCFTGTIDEVRISNTVRSAAWIKATYYSNWDELIDFGTDEKYPVNLYWSNRIKFVIDHTKVSSILYNFPVSIKISSESGITSSNITDVFDKLESNNNRKKIVITIADEVTQCSVEIERWDHINKEAFLWAKVPEISDSIDTVLYLYYDSSRPDNSGYVGDTGELPAEDVWNNDYFFVAHLSTRYDSTTSILGVSDSGNYVTANIAKGIYLDSTNSEYLDCGTMINGDNYTFETFFKTNDIGEIILQDSDISPMIITLTSGTLDLSIKREEVGVDKVNNQSMTHVCYHTTNGSCCDVSDDNASLYWQSYNYTSNWNRVDLGSGNDQCIGGIRLQGYSSYHTRMVNSFKVFGSNDASDWDELYAGNAAASTALQEFTFDTVTSSYRYYRFNIYSNHGDSLLCMTKIHYIEADRAEHSISKTGIYNDNEFHFLTAVRRNNNDLSLSVDGQTVSGTTDSEDYSNNTTPFFLGGMSGDYKTITFDEVRSSNVVRSKSWIEATYYSNMDDLIVFDNPVLWYYYGYITEEEIPVGRVVNLYNRTTGELISTTTSTVDTGYYYLTTTISGEHFIVTLDNAAGMDYNALILDKLLPRGIE